MKHLGDITKIDGAKIATVDIICGGSPCQDLSVAGKRAGLGGARSGLFMEQIRVIKEMRKNGNTTEPRFMVWENVPGAFSSNNGEDFRAVLEETAKIADENATIPRPENGKWAHSGCIMADGWSIAWRVHDAQFWGVPQRRRRIALVADFRGGAAPEILFERKSVSGDIEESFRAWQRATNSTENCIAETATLRTGVVPGAIVLEHHPNDSRIGIGKSNAIQTLSGRMGTGGGNVPMVMESVCVGNGQVNQAASDKAGALNCMHDQQAVMITYGLDRVAYNQGVNAQYDFSVEEEKIATQVAKGPGAVCNNYIVRRLTPLECERLQGFPDHWTDIGEWVDSKGKKHKGADSPRYKALGNSIALPFWQWMAERIVAVLKADGVEKPTMGSLFDGIGGFPLVFSCVGCDPIWASEIEEFPIAVTKLRFGGDET